MKNIVLLLSSLSAFILSGCSSVDKGMPEEVRKRLSDIPLVDINNLSTEDKEILDGKQRAMLNYLADWGFDPVMIGGYHVDLGCNYFLEKILPYRKTEIKTHNEFFVFRDYNSQFKDRRLHNSDFCDPLRKKLIDKVSDIGHYSQRLYTVTFTPNSEFSWDLTVKPGRFVPVDIKENLSWLYKKKGQIALRGEEEKEQHFLVLGCSKYQVPYPIFENGKVVGYETKIEQEVVEALYSGYLDYYMKRNLASASLRQSEHWVNCQDRVKFIKVE